MSGDYIKAHAERLDRPPGTGRELSTTDRPARRQQVEAPFPENGYAYLDGTIFAADPEFAGFADVIVTTHQVYRV